MTPRKRNPPVQTAESTRNGHGADRRILAPSRPTVDLARPDLIALLRVVLECLPVERLRISSSGVTAYVRVGGEE